MIYRRNKESPYSIARGITFNTPGYSSVEKNVKKEGTPMYNRVTLPDSRDEHMVS